AGGRADKLGDAAQAHAWLTAGLAAAAGIGDPKARASAVANLNAGLERLGVQPPSEPASQSRPPSEPMRAPPRAPAQPTPPPAR
ncbi:MAG TPA: conjugal transfer protein TrbL, partial [Candidatus Thermoplasmatota archaeon]|nr:conjugal transfer protein TrbL [Candidatus Thermoplasmatota archaeon]